MAIKRITHLLQASQHRGARITAIIGLSAIIVASAIPSLLEKSKKASVRETTITSLSKSISELQTKKDALTLRLSEKPPAVSVDLAAASGPHSESDVGYWRRQMQAYSAMRGVDLSIAGRSKSQFKDATKISVTVASRQNSAQRVNEALDFLQLFGYLESFDGATATIHIANSLKN